MKFYFTIWIYTGSLVTIIGIIAKILFVLFRSIGYILYFSKLLLLLHLVLQVLYLV